MVEKEEREALLRKKEERQIAVFNFIFDAVIIALIDFFVAYTLITSDFWQKALAENSVACIVLTVYAVGFLSFFIVELIILSRCFKEEEREDGEGWPTGFMLAMLFALGWPACSIVMIKANSNLKKKTGTGMHYHDLIDEFAKITFGPY